MKRCLPHGWKLKKEQLSTNDLRGHVTYVAFLSADAAVQAALPQVVIGNERKFTKAMHDSILKVGAGPVSFWRYQSAWNSHEKMRRILGLLSSCLQPWKDTHQPILLLDCASCHIHATVWGLASRYGIRLVFIPARLTFLLQPADTHLFFKFKASLKRKWLDEAVASDAGVVSDEAWLRVVITTVKELLSDSTWSHAFESNGIKPHQAGVSSRVLSKLLWDHVPLLPVGAPTLQQLRAIFPRRMKLKSTSILNYTPPKKKKPAAPAAGSSGPVVAAGPKKYGLRVRKKAQTK